jgi:hypothetical protein
MIPVSKPVNVRCSLSQQTLADKTITSDCAPCLLAVCAGVPSYSDSTFTWKDCDSQISVGGSCNASCDGYQEGPQGAPTAPCTTTGWGEVSGGCVSGIHRKLGLAAAEGFYQTMREWKLRLCLVSWQVRSANMQSPGAQCGSACGMFNASRGPLYVALRICIRHNGPHAMQGRQVWMHFSEF